MQKFLIGCLGVFVVLLLLGGGAGYWFIFRPAQGAIQNVQKLEQIETFNAQVSNERSFSAPADGVIAEEQLVRYIAVQDTMMTKLQSNIDRVNEKYKDFEDEDFSLADIRKLIGGYADIINLVLEAKQVQVTALNEQGFSLEEYAWVKREALRAAALPYTELDFSEFSGGREINLPALTDEIPEANIKLLEPHKDNLEDILGLAFFGLWDSLVVMREHDSSYVLRVWKDGKGEAAWRASLKTLNAPEQKLFKSLDDLLAFLKQVDLETCEAEA